MDKRELFNLWNLKSNELITAKDKITGFQGVVVGHADYLTGCDQFLLQPLVKKTDMQNYPEATWFDEGRLDVINVKTKNVRAKENGCDYKAPIK